MLETAVLSVRVIKNDSIWKAEIIKIFEILMEYWIYIAILVKKLLKALAMSDGLVIVSLLTVIPVAKLLLKLFEDIIFFIPFHVFLGL